MPLALDPNSTFKFPLYWTVGFSGKRLLPDESKAQAALEAALAYVDEKAREQGAKLTALSSVARGGDVLFATACRHVEGEYSPLPWKGLLPFAWDLFIAYDLPETKDSQSLPNAERKDRLVRAEACRQASFTTPEVVCPKANPADDEDRIAAYLECGYRTVDEADVMILLLRANEFAAVKARAIALETARHHGLPAAAVATVASTNSLKAGTRAVAHYALAARRPSILLNCDADNPADSNEWYIANDPARHQPPESWFVDPVTTPAVRHAEKIRIPPANQEDAGLRGPLTPMRWEVWELMERLGAIAGHHQRHALFWMKAIMSLHLGATTLAALGATVFSHAHDDFASVRMPVLVFFGLLMLALLKPVLAGSAVLIEHLLHKENAREEWLNARVLSELCRGALSLWPLPLQPLDATDEEDFPKLKRLIRTLRLKRALDIDAPQRGMTPGGAGANSRADETEEEANMREATDHYVEQRLRDQAEQYYGRKFPQHRREETRWRFVLHAALILTIVLGVSLVWHKWNARFRYSEPPLVKATPTTTPLADAKTHAQPAAPTSAVWKWVEALVIVGPFTASFALGMMTLLDCRRRVRRYPEVRHFLNRLADTLSQCSANPSRLRLIEQAERMMIEEQHEWFSVTRNFSI